MALTTRFTAIAAVIGVVVVAVGLAPPVYAQGGAGSATPSSLPAQVTLVEILKMLTDSSPRAAAIRSSVAVAAADRITAQTLPNPTVSYGGVFLVSGLSTGATTQHQVVVEQPLLMFHQRRTRLDTADLNVKAEEARVAEALAGRRAAVRAAFASLQSRQQQLQIVQESLTNMERLAQLVRGRAAAGDRSQYDVLRVEVETESVRVQAMDAAADVEEVAGQLAVLVGQPGWSPRASGPLEVGQVSTVVDSLWQTAQQRRPSLVAAREASTAARGGIFLARRERLPIPSVSAGTQTTRDVNGTSLFAGFSLPLPLFDHNQGAVAKATAESTAAELELQASLVEARAEIENAATVVNRRREALSAFEGRIGDRVPALRRMAEDAYREGSADILELLDANRSLRDLEIARVQQMEAVRLAEESLITAAGLDDQGTP